MKYLRLLCLLPLNVVRFVAALGVALFGAMFAGFAGATDPYADLISAVDFTSVTADVIAVAALVVVVLVAIRAVRFIYSIIRR